MTRILRTLNGILRVYVDRRPRLWTTHLRTLERTSEKGEIHLTIHGFVQLPLSISNAQAESNLQPMDVDRRHDLAQTVEQISLNKLLFRAAGGNKSPPYIHEPF